jgi:hypothetical protein
VTRLEFWNTNQSRFNNRASTYVDTPGQQPISKQQLNSNIPITIQPSTQADEQNTVSHTVITNDQRSLQIVASGIIAPDTIEDATAAISQTEIDLCRKWLSRATVSRPPKFSSFWVKHVVENWAGQHISNGALIVAAFQAGFEIAKPQGESGANVALGLDATDLREFDCGCGHP